MRNLTGQILNTKWRLERLIGRGGLGAVYEAVNLPTAARVAIKTLEPPDEEQADSLKVRFAREAACANRVKHGGVVPVYDFDTASDGTLFMVMELLHGQTVNQRWKECGSSIMATEEVLQITDDLLDILNAVHLAGIIHRDIKPANVFICSNQRTRLLDLGIALVVHEHRLTRTGVALGTYHYIPPEQVRGDRSLNARADIFGVGATMFRLLSGHHIFEAQNEPELLLKLSTERARSLAMVAPHLPAEVVRIVDTAIQFSPEERWGSARMMQEAVQRALRMLRPAPPSPQDIMTIAMTAQKSALQASLPALFSAALERPELVARLASAVKDLLLPELNTSLSVEMGNLRRATEEHLRGSVESLRATMSGDISNASMTQHHTMELLRVQLENDASLGADPGGAPRHRAPAASIKSELSPHDVDRLPDTHHSHTPEASIGALLQPTQFANVSDIIRQVRYTTTCTHCGYTADRWNAIGERLTCGGCNRLIPWRPSKSLLVVETAADEHLPSTPLTTKPLVRPPSPAERASARIVSPAAGARSESADDDDGTSRRSNIITLLLVVAAVVSGLYLLFHSR